MPSQQSQPLRFTVDGSSELEQHLDSVCAKVRAGVRALVPNEKMDGLLLAGGYGRGEGGVLHTSTGDQPYNDMEFYVFIRGNRLLADRNYRAALHELGVGLTQPAGLDIEFKVLTINTLRRSAPSMFYYDLVLGHRWLIGDDALLSGCEHHRDAGKIPLHEATRLLMNRCSGLLFSAERLSRADFGPAEADFVGRNHAKVQLALGDVLLAASQQYDWSCRERHARLLQLDGLADQELFAAICAHHTTGVAFKLHPCRSLETRSKLTQRQAELSDLARRLWLWLENRRLSTNFTSTREYALSACNKCPEQPGWRNRLVNVRECGIAGISCARYPRQRLQHALCLLLWENNLHDDTAGRQRVQQELRSQAGDFAGLVEAYQHLWHRFN
ncbi:MAG: hypothetical protein WCO56_14355 [Verrucomicrobiota bacterium]